jgi:hypothetical protein
VDVHDKIGQTTQHAEIHLIRKFHRDHSSDDGNDSNGSEAKI